MATDLDCWLATVEQRSPERILYHASFTPDLKRRLQEHTGCEDLRAFYGMLRTQPLSLKPPDDYVAPDFSRYYQGRDLPEETVINAIGVAQVPAGFYHFWHYVSPLAEATSLKELEDYPLPDVRQWDGSHLKATADRAHEAGIPAVGSVGHMYETAWQIRGYEQFLMDTIERPSWAECLLERLAENNRILARAFAEAGADWIRCGDDVANQQAMMFSPDMWRRLMRSRWEPIWQECKQIKPSVRIWYHSDGNITPIVPELIEAGVDILNPIQPECLDTDELHNRYGDRLIFDGCIGTQSTMPWGTPEDVRTRVREVINRYGRGGGLIISPTHTLEPEVPLENVDALFDACREYGRV